MKLTLEEILNMSHYEWNEHCKKETNLLYEGLIFSHNKTTLRISMSNNNFFLPNLKNTNDKLVIGLLTKEHIEHLNHHIFKLEQLLNLHGWYVATIRDLKKNKSFSVKNITHISTLLLSDTYLIILEPKFDMEIENIPKLLYHTTLQDYRHKILKKGLIPKSKHKLIYHPDRIYFTKTEKDAQQIGKELHKKTDDIDIYKVSTDNLHVNMRFFNDINYKNGIYIMDNIPPYNLELMV